MAGAYTAPAVGVDVLIQQLNDIQDRLKELERATGTQTAGALKTLQQLVAGLINQTNLSVAGTATIGGNTTIGGWINAIDTHGRTLSTGYVSVYVDSSGRYGISPSAKKFKQNILPRTYTLEEIAKIQVVSYRLRAAVKEHGDAARVEVGVIANQLVDAGFPEFVIFDSAGEPFTVAYERLDLVALIGVQLLTGEITSIKARLDAAGI